MQDEQIVALYWERDERAIRETDKSYRCYLFKIANNILKDEEDSNESLNDTYLKAWNSMPPARPTVLSLFLGKIIRGLSIDRWRTRSRQKRGGGEYAESLHELEDCVSAGNTTEKYADARALGETLNKFLKMLSAEERGLFIGRYFYADSLREAAQHYQMSESKAKSMLHRIRLRLKKYLESEGYFI